MKTHLRFVFVLLQDYASLCVEFSRELAYITDCMTQISHLYDILFGDVSGQGSVEHSRRTLKPPQRKEKGEGL